MARTKTAKPRPKGHRTAHRRGQPTLPTYDLVLRGGRVIDPARGIDGLLDVAVRDGKIVAVARAIEASPRTKTLSVRGKIVIPGMIDTHSHIYQYVTGTFGMNPDLVGIRSGVTTVVDQGGAAPLTIHGFRKFIAEPAVSRVYAFISNYLVGGLVGHRHVLLYSPQGINTRETVKAIEQNRDIVKGVKAHAEVGGYSRWGIETLKLAKEAAREARVPLYVHLGRLWSEADGSQIDPDRVVPEMLPLLDPGDILAHPFTKNSGAFVSREGKVHPLLFEAVARGVHVDIGRGGHLSFAAARAVLDAGLRPFTVGADIHGYTLNRPEEGVWDGSYWEERVRRREERGTPVGGIAVFSLVQVMTELLALGISFEDVIPMVTSNAAVMLGLQGEIGTLAPGVTADVSVIALDKGEWRLQDSLGQALTTTQRIRPEFALRAGVLHRADSPLLFESTREVA